MHAGGASAAGREDGANGAAHEAGAAVEAALRASEARFWALATASADVVYRMSPDWGEMRRLDGRGFLADTLEPSDAWLARYVPPDDQARVRAAITDAVQARGVFALEHRVVRADGTLGWTFSRAVPLLAPDGEVLEWIGTAADVTARREADDALRASEARLRLALDVAELGTWSWNPATNTGHLDARGAEIVGLAAGELADVWAAQVASIHPTDLAATLAAAQAGVASGEAFALNYRVVAPDGTVRHVASRARADLDAAGRPVRLTGTNRDATAERDAAVERERLLAAAEAARAEAEAARAAAETANRTKSEFLAVMSHELRTPLNAIGGYAELMEMGLRGPVSAQQREDLRRVQASQRHLLGLINEVLNYAKLETGTVHYDVRSVGVRTALAGAEALIAPQAQGKALALAVGEAPPDLAVRADAEKLRQILVNLLSNAVKFTAPGGRVELACVAVDGPHGARVHLTVRDTGIGIAADQLERIFEPFVQVRSDLTRTAEGTGLGLAISRDLARGMHGDLTVESTEAAGSTFTLVLPRG